MKFINGMAIEFVPASHEDPRSPGVLKKVLATKSELLKGQIQMVNWSKLGVGKSFNAHYHEDMQEIFIMISGKANIRIEQEQLTVQSGDAFIVEPREVHQMKNVGMVPVEYIVFGVSTEENGRTVNV